MAGRPGRGLPAGLLIRPDGYVAWAAPADPQDGPAHHGSREALSSWFGEPA
ncbi:hypothetical protein [Streptosporangium lutulentum]|uniref:FAD-dependent oxidoreductase n=1 Tax=Streptosporangium lutulentum TaxID=1461250 RepID=A0ABT9Q6Y6_9ACTN|nr:hypothetical protein [Streptosporangium lutulentum]MDP9842501.1 hypothetical protein [Streptosporangium lutulentum]